jgi:hypothetical protein
MEWMLQAVDEVDDAVSAVRLYAMGIAAELRFVAGAGAAVFALCAAFVTHAG